MKRDGTTGGMDDADARAVRRVSRAVGLQITITSSVLVLAVLGAALVFVFVHIPPARLFAGTHETTIDVGGVDILLAGIGIGSVAVILAGTMSWFATRRAVRPLADALRIQRAFVADASHELRTPLTVLDARLQLLQRGLRADDPSASTVSELRRDTNTLIEIVNDLLVSAEINGPNPNRNSPPVAINPVVSHAVDSMRIIATDRGVGIVFDNPGPLATLMPGPSVQRCVVALLDNALDFSPPGTTVVVTLSAAKSMVRLAVRDQGRGIQGIEPGRIFDRFARSGTAVGGGTRTGFGIGLALVRDTVERFGGSAAVSETNSSGTEIRLLIPVARPASRHR